MPLLILARDDIFHVPEQTMKVDGVRPTEKFYMALLRATGEGGRTDKTVEVLDEMKEIGMKPGVRSYNCAVGACGKVLQCII